ncbi:MAG: hypothetical protein V8T51_01015 [Senegalimassilia faecalis]
MPVKLKGKMGCHSGPQRRVSPFADRQTELLKLRRVFAEEVEARGQLADAMAAVFKLQTVAQLVHVLEVEVPAEEVLELEA